MRRQTLKCQNNKWSTTYEKCGQTYEQAPSNYTFTLQQIFDYAHIDCINLNTYYSTVYYKCLVNQYDGNTVDTCEHCAKAGCHLATAASDAELVNRLSESRVT